MTTQPAPFAFQGTEVRVEIDDRGEPWFVASDVAKVLGYRDAHNLTRRLDTEDRGTRSMSTPSGQQDMTVINEAGLYAAVLGSQVEGAREFKRWVTREVLPSIRRTGGYGQPQRELTRIELAQMVIDAENAKAAALAVAEHAQAQVRQLEVPAAAWQHLAAAEGDYSVQQAAKILDRDPNVDVGERRLFKVLEDLNWIYRDRRHGMRGSWSAYQTALNTGRLVHRARHHQHPQTGVTVLDPPQVRVTAKGLAELRTHLGVAPELATDLVPV